MCQQVGEIPEMETTETSKLPYFSTVVFAAKPDGNRDFVQTTLP